MSVEASASVPAAKICTVCGQDVTQQKRTKDEKGNYYCGPCWSFKLERLRQVQGGIQGAQDGLPTTADPAEELPFCEACQGRFTVEYLRDHNGQILCVDCVKERSQPRRAAALPRRTVHEVPEHVKKIIATNPLILLAFVAGAVACIPFAIPLVLVVVWVARRLLNALSVTKQTRWLIGCAIPLIGLLVFKRVIDMAAREVDAHRPKTDPLSAIEREQYGRLVLLDRIGWAIVLCGTAVLFLVTGRWGWDNLFGLVGLGVMATAAIKKVPYHRRLRDAGYGKLWFATSNPIQQYADQLERK